MSEDELEREREAVLDVHRRYLVANGKLDTETLAELWSHDPTNVFFNLTGHSYRGLEHWSQLWKYYSTRFETVFPWCAWDHNVTIHGDVAWVTCQRVSQLRWIGEGEGPIDDETPMISRSTEIYVKEDGQWRAAHVHYSRAAMTPRPGNI